jgi:hypothetical protein
MHRITLAYTVTVTGHKQGHQIPRANRASAEVAIDVFAEKYGAKYDKAVECLTKDRDALLALYDFPAEHWDHLRTTDEIDKRFLSVPVVILFRGVGDLVAKRGASAESVAGRPSFKPCQIEAPARPFL